MQQRNAAMACRTHVSLSHGVARLMSLVFCMFVVLLGCLPEPAAGGRSTGVSSSARGPRRRIALLSLPFPEHLTPLMLIASELKTRGHNVTIFSYNEAQSKVAELGLPYVSLGAFPIDPETLQLNFQAIARLDTPFNTITALVNDVYLPATFQTYHNALRLLRELPHDMLVVDAVTFGGVEVAKTLELPVVVNSPDLVFDVPETMAATLPAWGSGYQLRVMALMERCANVLYPQLLSVALAPQLMALNQLRFEIGLPAYSSLQDVATQSRTLVNSAVGLDYSRRRVPMLEMVGPIVPPKALLKPLPEHVTSWLKEMSHSARYIVFVNFEPSVWMEDWQVDAIVRGLGNPSTFAVIWGVHSDHRFRRPPLPEILAHVPKAIKVLQLDGVMEWSILSDKRVNAVISSCGTSSAERALYYSKPVLCLPFFGNQFDVAARIVDNRVGLALPKRGLTPSHLRLNLGVMLEVGSVFPTNSAKLGGIVRRAGGRRRAADVIEATAQAGVEHLLTAGALLPWHRAHMIDAYCLLLALLLLVATAVSTCSRALIRLVSSRLLVNHPVIGGISGASVSTKSEHHQQQQGNNGGSSGSGSHSRGNRHSGSGKKNNNKSNGRHNSSHSNHRGNGVK